MRTAAGHHAFKLPERGFRSTDIIWKQERALLALKRRKLHEQQLQRLGAWQLNVEQLLSNIEVAKQQHQLFDALKAGNEAVASLQQEARALSLTCSDLWTCSDWPPPTGLLCLVVLLRSNSEQKYWCRHGRGRATQLWCKVRVGAVCHFRC